MHKRAALGKGLGALISSADTEISSGVKEIKINEIEPNLNQPRKNFDDDTLSKLAESIKHHGIVQPLIVMKDGGVYRIVAGERRWRAAKIAGLSTVPVIIKDLSPRQVMEIALIENLQREDLNPIEEAEAYERLLKEYNMTQEEISSIVGKSRPAIANSLRLLNLSAEVKNWLISGELSSGHGRALAAIEDSAIQVKTANEVIEKNLNVRETEKLVKRFSEGRRKRKEKNLSAEYIEIEEKLKSVFGTKVKLINSNNKKGKIIIEYYSMDDLDRIMRMIDSLEKNKETKML
jgi:ParB family chromosome partitioning protein